MMAPSHGNDAGFSKSLKTLTSPLLLPTLPFDLMPDILCKLPLKLLLQLRCLCKSWNSLISDPKFTKKHLSMSKASHHLMVSTIGGARKPLLWDSLICSLFSAVVSNSSVTQTQLSCPSILKYVNGFDLAVCSCDGILCFTIDENFPPLLWNPSIRKFKMFPPVGNLGKKAFSFNYSFGYDQLTHNYKIVVVFFFYDNTNQVSVYTLGTDSWRRIQDFPYHDYTGKLGVFVSGAINWLAYHASSSFIVSLDLEEESYQNLLLPNVETNHCTLGVLKDCLCTFVTSDMFVNVWIMKEYKNEESWTKLYSVPYVRDRTFFPYEKVLCITEDDQVLLYYQDSMILKFVVYDSKNGTFNMPQLQNISDCMDPEVYVESLISPCS